jgi:hypothetical protein
MAENLGGPARAPSEPKRRTLLAISVVGGEAPPVASLGLRGRSISTIGSAGYGPSVSIKCSQLTVVPMHALRFNGHMGDTKRCFGSHPDGTLKRSPEVLRLRGLSRAGAGDDIPHVDIATMSATRRAGRSCPGWSAGRRQGETPLLAGQRPYGRM